MDLTCPACTAPELRRDSEGNFACPYCGSYFISERTECPACGANNEQGSEQCYNCGEPLSIVASVIDRQGGTGRLLWIRRLQSQVADLKSSEAQASADRLEEFIEVDRKRMQREAEAYARSKQTERNILFYGAAAFLLIVLIGLVLFAIR